MYLRLKKSCDGQSTTMFQITFTESIIIIIISLDCKSTLLYVQYITLIGTYDVVCIVSGILFV